MNCEISITLQLDDLDTATYEYCKENSLDYSDLIDDIADELRMLDGVDRVSFNHSSWIKIDLGTDNFSTAEKETDKCISEVTNVFASHGITV